MKGTDGWGGQYINILSQDKMFLCDIDYWLKESDGRSQQTFTCNLGKGSRKKIADLHHLRVGGHPKPLAKTKFDIILQNCNIGC